ncbi:MAG: hypothetical protein QOK37_4089 [Thermoanaerobaculia bacterium]|nr:hypothetical protein [Thermoanaerobaculia bacterium]
MHSNTSNLTMIAGKGLRLAGAAALFLSIAAVGCTTNRTPGAGMPSSTVPAVAPASTPGNSSGTSNPPMASAMGANIDRANDAAAIMAAHQRERYLGVVNPSGVQTQVAIAPSVNSQSTSSEMLLTGDGTYGEIVSDSGTASTTANATVSGTAVGSNPTLVTPTTAATTATPGQFAAGPNLTTSSATSSGATTVLSPTRSSGMVPSPNVAARNGASTTIVNRSTSGTTTLTPTLSSAVVPSPNVAANGAPRTTRTTLTPVVSPSSSSRTATSSVATRGRVMVPIRVVTNADGTVSVTNVAGSPTVVKNQ